MYRISFNVCRTPYFDETTISHSEISCVEIFCSSFDTFSVNEKLEIKENSSTFVLELTRNIHLRIIHRTATLHITSLIRKFVNIWFLFLLEQSSVAYSENQENKSRDKFIVISKTKTLLPQNSGSMGHIKIQRFSCYTVAHRVICTLGFPPRAKEKVVNWYTLYIIIPHLSTHIQLFAEIKKKGQLTGQIE